MKKDGILHPEIAYIIATMGHKDTLVIADAGLPVPDSTMRIDLALTQGLLPFLTVLAVVLNELEVEGAMLAQEIGEVSPNLYRQAQDTLGEIPIELIPHEELKSRSKSAKAIIRTGEFAPYANIILRSGVVF